MENQEQLQLVKARQEAEFALTIAGQEAKKFEVMQRKGKMFATSTIVPVTYQNNVGNCVIALEMADRMGAAPLMVMQNLYIVHGNPAWSSKFLIACINTSGRFSPLRFEFKGEEGEETYGCRCYAYEKHDTQHKEPLYGDWITLEMARKEGWLSKNGSKWASMPNQMLRYRAAAFWQRVYCPEISMGLMTADEVEDTYTPYEDVTEASETTAKNADIVRQAMTAQVKEQPQPEEAAVETAQAEAEKDSALYDGSMFN